MADISKIKLANGTTVTLKDARGRTDFGTLLGTNTLKALEATAWHAMAASISDGDGKIADAATVKAYVDAQVQAIPTFDVVVVADGQDLPTASADTFHKIYLKKDTGVTSGTYAEYITVRTAQGTTPETYTYSWERVGTIEADLAAYVKKTTTIAGIDLQDNITVAELQTALGLKALAYKDKGSVTISTADSITMNSYSPAGTIAMNDLVQTSTAATLTKGNFTPNGQILVDGKAQSGEDAVQAIKGGSINVTVKDAAATTEAGLTYAAYTPSGSVSIQKDNTNGVQISGTVSKPTITVNDDTTDTFVKSLKAGTTDAAAFTEGKFTPASINATKFFNAGALPTKAADTFNAGSFTKGDAVKATTEGIVASIDTTDSEMLVFTTAATGDVMSHNAVYVAPSYTEGTFAQGSLPSIDVEQGFNGGAKAADTFTAQKLPVVDATAAAVTAVTAELDAAPTFTGDKFAASFSGTEVAQMKVTKAEYLKQEINTATFTPVATTISFSGTEAQNVLVTGVTYDKATANGATFSGNAATLTGSVNKTAKTVDVAFSVNE